MSEDKYLVVVQKVTNISSGESIQISVNLPRSISKEDMLAEVQKILWVTEERLIQQNEKVLAITEATRQAFEDLGVTNNPQ